MYREDLAYVHHKGFGRFISAVGPELVRLLKSRGIASGHVVDLGCGDGTWLRALTAAGFTATGIDQSSAFVRLARRAAPRAAVRHASLYRAAIPRCDAITALGEVLNYLPARSTGSSSLARLFRRAHSALRQGGLLIFDLLVAGRPPINRDTARFGRDWAVFARVREDQRRARLSRHIVTFRRRGTQYVRGEEVHELRVPTRSEVIAGLRKLGFHVRVTTRYGRVRVDGRHAVFVATRGATA
jgi:SAM-dependent methyltransferase